MKSLKTAVSRPARHLTFGNIIACLALFIALGGISWAAVKLPKNSVGSKQIKKNAVINSKIKKNAITSAKIKTGAVAGSDIKDEAVSGVDIDESSLGTVPSATTTSDRVFGTHKVSSTAANNDPNVARAAATEVPLASNGSVSVYGKCFEDLDNPTIYFETFVRTTANGSLLNGYSVSDTLYGNPALNTNTAEDLRQLNSDSTGANSIDEDTAEDATLLGPDGVGLIFNIFALGRHGNPADPTSFTPGANTCYFQIDGRKIG